MKTNQMPTALAVLALLAVAAAGPAAAQARKAPTTREMSLLCWQEFGELVPARIVTVLVPFGSLEPHGVIPNGTDSLAPAAMARAIADRADALIAPVLNFGVTEAMKAYPGAVSIPPEVYAPFAESVLDNLAANGFRNLIVLNGHGGNTAALNAAATKVANARRVRVLVVNWWTLADDITKAVFKQNGGHAGNNETAYMQAIGPEHVHPERYKPEMAAPNPSPAGAYYAVPVPSTILLYEKGQGYPTFDAGQAKEYFRRVNDRVAELVLDTIKKWDLAGVYK
jgi:creatinine amidohydrolase